jgi:hypothetical protein
MVGVELGEECELDAMATPLQDRHLVVDAARPTPPAALQEQSPAVRHDAADPPALRSDDVGEEVARVAAVADRDVGHQVLHEADLIPWAGTAFAPDIAVAEVAHAGEVGQPLDPPAPGDVPHLGRRNAVGAADHRPQQGAVMLGEPGAVPHPQE